MNKNTEYELFARESMEATQDMEVPKLKTINEGHYFRHLAIALYLNIMFLFFFFCQRFLNCMTVNFTIHNGC